MKSKLKLLAALLFVLGGILVGNYLHAESSDGPLTVVTHVDVIPDAYMAGAEESAALLFRIECAASRQDEGSVSYVVLQEVSETNHFTIIETWRDAKAHALHVGSQHTVKFRLKIQPFLGSPFDARLNRQFH